MKSREYGIALFAGLVLGTLLALALNGPSAIGSLLAAVRDGAATLGYGARVPTASTSSIAGSQATETSVPVLQGTPGPAATVALPGPSLTPVAVGGLPGADLEDVVLLFDPAHPTSFDANFCLIAEYYGLRCKQLDLGSQRLTKEMLQDEQGNAFRLIGVSAPTILRASPRSDQELDIVRAAIEEGASLLISQLYPGLDLSALNRLTDGAVAGVTSPDDLKREWQISSDAPDITRELTGQLIAFDSAVGLFDSAIDPSPQARAVTLISSQSKAGIARPILIYVKKGAGSVFVDAGEPGPRLTQLTLREMYYEGTHFSSIVPLMMTMRYAAGDEAWHSDHNYANLTLDDPALTEPYLNLSYPALLTEMEAHNFHTTIAMHPVTWSKAQPNVVRLFRDRPNRYSVVEHGNNGDGYEFYKYTVSPGDPDPARPFADQAADIVEALGRMATFTAQTGIPTSRVMIFPEGIGPEPTLVFLKKFNYLGTVNAQDVPLGETRPTSWDFGMHPAILDFGDFPMLTRRHPGTYEPFRPNVQPFILDLFVDKPALFYSHASATELFAESITAFDPVADRMNAVQGGVEWRGLADILKNLYLTKLHDDGSVDVQMYTNDLLLTNSSTDERTFHIRKVETLSVPILRLAVNGRAFPYRIEGDQLALDAQIPGNSTVEISICYGDQAP